MMYFCRINKKINEIVEDIQKNYGPAEIEKNTNKKIVEEKLIEPLYAVEETDLERNSELEIRLQDVLYYIRKCYGNQAIYNFFEGNEINLIGINTENVEVIGMKELYEKYKTIKEEIVEAQEASL